MKNPVIVVATVVVVAAAAPYAVGLQVEHESAAYLKELLDLAPYVTVAKHSYQRGWLSSEEEITFRPVASLAPALASAVAGLPIQVTIHNTIHHGPLPGFAGVGLATIDTRTVPPAGVSDAYAKVLAAAPPFHTELNLFGGGRLVIRGPKLADTEIFPGWHIASDGSALAITFGRHFDTLDMDMSAAHFSVAKAEGFSGELTGMLLKSRSHRVLRSLYAGTADGTLGDFAVTTPMPGDAPKLDFGLSAAQYHSEQSMAGEYINGGMLLSARSAHFTDTRIEGIKFDVAYEHWQADALERLADGMRVSNRNFSATPAEKAAQLLTVMKTAGVALVAHDPVVKFNDIEFAMPQGFAKISGSMRVTGAKDSDFIAPVNVPAVLAKVSAEFDLALDDALADRLAHPQAPAADAPKKGPPPPDPLQLLIDQGFVTRDGGKTRTKLAYAGGVFTMNGKPFTPAALQPPPPPPKGAAPGSARPRAGS